MKSETQVVAITQRLTFVESYGEERESLDTQWYDFVRRLGSVQLVPISYKSDPGAFLDRFCVSCVILSGGNDVHQEQQQVPKDIGETLSVKRDRFERELTVQARLRGIRVLGVCRGLQVLALHYGATIVPVSSHVGRSHTLHCIGACETSTKLAKNCLSLLFEKDGSLKGGEVNSYHNYAPLMTSSLQHGVEVLAVPTNLNIIEAFVQERDQVLAIMWHPERSHGLAQDRDIALVRSFLAIQDEISASQANNTGVRVIVLCAGQGTRLRPLTDDIPKCMVQYKGRAIVDYLLSVYHYHEIDDVTLVTGYKAHKLKRPGVKYVYNENYASSNMVKSLFCALLLDEGNDQRDLIVSYSDIIYTQDVLGRLISSSRDADMMVVIDVDWLRLWQSRMEDPLSDAETLKIGSDGFLREIGKKPETYDDIEGQYIGLMKFTATGVVTMRNFFLSLDVHGVYDGKTMENMYMTTLLQLMIDSGIKILPVFINGGWIEIDCKEDLQVDIDFSMIPTDKFRGQSQNFATKARTLANLSQTGVGEVLPLIYFNRADWQRDDVRRTLQQQCIDLVNVADGGMLIVRSSAANEDSLDSSAAGRYDTLKNILPIASNIEQAVNTVFASYTTSDNNDEVLVQPMLQNVDVCGVLCTTELQDYMPYFVLSYEEGGGTDAVTSGTQHDIRTMYISKHACKEAHFPLRWQWKLLQIAQSLEEIFKNDKLDIEFATKGDCVYLLQVRPVVVPEGMSHLLSADFITALEEVYTDVWRKLQHDEILDNMMDWNPAEMIGVLPSTLARTLYELLITDEIAMQSRAQLGYRDVSHEPLMLTIAGRPFVRASVSFESFIPASLHDSIARKLVRHYLSVLRESPAKHDKVEFEIVFSCFEPDLDTRLSVLNDAGFTSDEQNMLKRSLLDLTNEMIGRVDNDLATLALLAPKVSILNKQTSRDIRTRLAQTIELTQTFGTLPFANLARCAFVAVSILNSLVRSGHMSVHAKNDFMESLYTVSKALSDDLTALRTGEINKQEFLRRYGHLRPGTYNICNSRYDENFGLYFSEVDSSDTRHSSKVKEFHLDDLTRAGITRHLRKSGMAVDCEQLFEFCRKSIEGRERAKFIFTAVVSNILVDIAELGSAVNIHKFDMSFLDMKAFLQQETLPGKAFMWENITHNRTQLRVMSKIKLPSTIRAPDEIHVHEENTVRPNFITKKTVTGVVVTENNLFDTSLDGKIIVVESADPGWDWLFSNKIAGLVTCYGGANSHMAIRAAELSLPAAIGVGTVKFKMYTDARRLHIDASSQTISIQ